MILRFPQMQNKYVYFLKEGFIKIGAMNEEGKEVIKYLLKPGDMFGEVAILNDTECSDDYAMALEDCVINFIDTDRLKHLMLLHPVIREEIAMQICRRLKKAEKRLLSLSFKDAYTRICDFIIDFTKEFGTHSDEAYEVKNFLTHDDIAKLTTTSRQTVSSTLSELREKKIIEYNNEVLRLPCTSILLNKN
jgi:CRP/FNR family cyclic AMP-dependent transcriptional regulator